MKKRRLIASSTGVAHHLPHRTRLKVPLSHRNKQVLSRVHDSLKKVPGVHKVEVNERTGSVIVHHEEHEDVLAPIGGAIEGVAGDLFELMLEAEEIEFPGISVLAHLIGKVAGGLNTGIAKSSDNVVDLKMVLPVGFLALGIRQAMANPGWWAEVPAYVLFYYAYDSFMRFNAPSQLKGTPQLEGNGAHLETESHDH